MPIGSPNPLRVFAQAIKVLGNIFSTGDITAGSQGTGGNTVYARHYYANTAGAVHWYDLNGSVYEVAKLGPDSQPAINFVLNVGNITNGLAPAWSIDTSTLDITFSANVNWLGQELFGSRAGGVILTGQSTTTGLVTPLLIRAKNSSGTIVGSLSFTNAGLVQIPNNSALATAFQLTNGWGKADGWGNTTETNKGTVTSTVTIDWSADGQAQRLTLTSATNLTITFTAPPMVGWLTLKTISPASGTVPTITWPASVKWAGATKPTQASTLGRANVQRFYYDGTNYWGDAIVNAG